MMSTNVTKIKITEHVGEIELDTIEVSELIKQLQEFSSKYPNETLTAVPNGGYDGFYEFIITYERDESDEEYDSRMDSEKNRLAKQKIKAMGLLMTKQVLTDDEQQELIEYIKGKK